jgi:hypothetical protein
MTSITNNKYIYTREDCNVCVENVVTEQCITCPYCNFKSCITCCQTFLMSLDDPRPRCMDNNCKKIWSNDFMHENFPLSFQNGKYRKRRAFLLLEKEKSLLPSTQGLYEEMIRKKKINEDIKELQLKNFELKKAIQENNALINMYGYSITEVKNDAPAKVCIGKCTVEDCRGFLDTENICGVCKKESCSKCESPLDFEHKCDKEKVLTVRLLKKDCKPCPGCSIKIFKIEGCDQMYCTQCHTVFSWIRGKIETGNVHNPHYFDAQFSGKGEIVRNFTPFNEQKVNNVCFEQQNMFRDMFQHLFSKKSRRNSLLSDIFRETMHIKEVVLPNYSNKYIENKDNSDLRIKYLAKEINEKQWISSLQSRTKLKEKQEEFSMIISAYLDMQFDLFTAFLQKDIDIEKCMKSVRIHINLAFQKIGISYGNIYPGISETQYKFINNFKNHK